VPSGQSYNHLRDARAAERLAAHERLALDAGEEVAQGRKRQEDGRRDQAGRPAEVAQPLRRRHGGVGCRAHVVGLNPADGGVERGRRRADPEEEGHLNEEDDEGGYQADDAEDDDHDVEGKDVGNAQGKAKDHVQDAQPLSINAEISRRELFFESHVARVVLMEVPCVA